MDNEKIASELIRIAKSLVAGSEHPLDTLESMKVLARKIGYKLYPHPMRVQGYSGQSWSMENDGKFIEVQVAFEGNGKVDLSIVSLDDFSQEPIAEKLNVRVNDFNGLLREIAKLERKALSNPIVEHLKLEQGLNRGARDRTAQSDVETFANDLSKALGRSIYGDVDVEQPKTWQSPASFVVRGLGGRWDALNNYYYDMTGDDADVVVTIRGDFVRGKLSIEVEGYDTFSREEIEIGEKKFKDTESAQNVAKWIERQIDNF